MKSGAASEFANVFAFEGPSTCGSDVVRGGVPVAREVDRKLIRLQDRMSRHRSRDHGADTGVVVRRGAEGLGLDANSLKP
jgi:hypothetical protein